MTHAIKDMVNQLSPREQFKFAFLEKCAEMGLSNDEMLERAEDVLNRIKYGEDDWASYLNNALKGTIFAGGLYGAHKALGPWLPALAIGGPALGGALVGRSIAKMQEPTDADIKNIQHQEKIDEYKKQISRLQKEKRIRDYREQDTGKGGRPLL